MDKTASISVLQFEYERYGFHIFLQVHKTFKHYYTEETMRYVQLDYMNHHGARTIFKVLNEAEFEALYNARIKEPDDET